MFLGLQLNSQIDSWALSSGLNKLLGLGSMVRESKFFFVDQKKKNGNLKCVKFQKCSKKIFYSELKERQSRLLEREQCSLQLFLLFLPICNCSFFFFLFCIGQKSSSIFGQCITLLSIPLTVPLLPHPLGISLYFTISFNSVQLVVACCAFVLLRLLLLLAPPSGKSPTLCTLISILCKIP